MPQEQRLAWLRELLTGAPTNPRPTESTEYCSSSMPNPWSGWPRSAPTSSTSTTPLARSGSPLARIQCPSRSRSRNSSGSTSSTAPQPQPPSPVVDHEQAGIEGFLAQDLRGPILPSSPGYAAASPLPLIRVELAANCPGFQGFPQMLLAGFICPGLPPRCPVGKTSVAPHQQSKSTTACPGRKSWQHAGTL